MKVRKRGLTGSTYHLVQSLLYFVMEGVFIGLVCLVGSNGRGGWSDVQLALALVAAGTSAWISCKHGIAYLTLHYCEDTHGHS